MNLRPEINFSKEHLINLFNYTSECLFSGFHLQIIRQTLNTSAYRILIVLVGNIKYFTGREKREVSINMHLRLPCMGLWLGKLTLTCCRPS